MKPAVALALVCIAFPSCSEKETPTYRVASDEETRPNGKPSFQAAAVPPQPLRWKAPESWEPETPGQYQTALYRPASGGSVSISKFPGDAGGIPANMNRWREQIGLEPTSEPVGDIIALEAGDSHARWFELKGETESILAAVVPVGAETWFFELSTTNSDLEAGRPEFISLLKSIEIGDKPEALEKPGINLEVPDGWEKNRGNEMRVASFRIPAADGENGIDGDVSVIPLQGDGGSDLENVNRWRAQLRLPALESESDPEIGETKKGNSGSFLLTRMVSKETLFSGDRHGAITTAILRKGDFTWFFKIAGEAEMIDANHEAFETLVRTAIPAQP